MQLSSLALHMPDADQLTPQEIGATLELKPVALLTLSDAGSLTAPLANHVGRVIGGCAEPQVAGIAAGWVVARVANKQALRNGAKVEHPGDPTAIQRTAATAGIDTSIPCVCHACEPGPAVIGGPAAEDFLPEPLSDAAPLRRSPGSALPRAVEHFAINTQARRGATTAACTRPMTHLRSGSKLDRPRFRRPAISARGRAVPARLIAAPRELHATHKAFSHAS
jgi:hypothetical protein